MGKIRNTLTGMLILGMAYAANVSYHSNQALKTATELYHTNDLVRILECKKNKLDQEAFNITVIRTENHSIKHGLFYQGGRHVQVVSYDEKSLLDELGEKARDLHFKLGEAQSNQFDLEKKLKEHSRKRFTIF